MSFYYLTSHKEGREVVYFLYITLWSYLSQPFLMLNGGSEVRSHSYLQPHIFSWAVVVAQLVEQSLTSHRSLVRIQSTTNFIINCIEKTKIKRKEAGNGPIKNIYFPYGKYLTDVGSSSYYDLPKIGSTAIEKISFFMGSGCVSVGRAVSSYTRGPLFESSHRQTFIWNICLLSTVLKKRKEVGNGPIKKRLPSSR